MYKTITIINKCHVQDCNKKLSTTELITCKCKCDNNYCLIHRLSEKHNCTYNFKKEIDVAGFIEKNKCNKQKIVKL